MFDLSKDSIHNIQILFTQEATALEETIKKAINVDCLIKYTKVQTADIIKKEDFFGQFELEINGFPLHFYLSINARIASVLSDLMLMGPGEAKDSLESDDIDSLKELFSQGFGGFATAMREIGYKANFNGFSQIEPKEGSFFESEFEIIISNIESGLMVQYVEVNEFEAFLDSLNIKLEEKAQEEEMPLFELESKTSNNTQRLQNDNLDLLLDIDLNAHVRIGSKQMLLKDIVKLSEGTIIDLDKSVDEPMEILVNGKIIARGIVVVVGGNFGIKITHIGTKEDRIRSLGG